MGLRLRMTNTRIESKGLYSEYVIIDSETGETIRPAAVTPELEKFLQTVEIDLSDYFHIVEMKKQNPAFAKLINTFNLVS